MQRKTRMSRCSNRHKKTGRLRRFETKVHCYLEELGHDVSEFGDDVNKFLHGVEKKLDKAGHTYEKAVKVLKSKKNFANYSFMMSTDPVKRKATIKDLERWIRFNAPGAKVHWGKERGIAYAWENKSPFQDFRISNVSLQDTILLHSALSVKGVGGFKL